MRRARRGALRIALALGAGLGVLVLARPDARAGCGACRGVSGAGAALTAPDERWNLSLFALGRYEFGRWTSAGRARAEPPDVHAEDLAFTLAGAVRVVRPLELAVAGGFGVAWFDAPGLDTVGAGLTDLTSRVRWEILADDPAAPPARPAVATWFTLSAPTGSLPQGATGAGSAAGLVGAFGLGTWEFALGADVRRTIADRVQPFLAAEGALRAPDHAPGFDRALGPRVTARAGVTVFFGDPFALSVMGEWNAEGDLALRGQSVAGSWQHRTSAVIAASVRAENGLRFGALVASDVLADGLGRNATATVRLGLTIGYSGVEAAWRACPMPRHDPAHHDHDHDHGHDHDHEQQPAPHEHDSHEIALAARPAGFDPRP